MLACLHACMVVRRGKILEQAPPPKGLPDSGQIAHPPRRLLAMMGPGLLQPAIWGSGQSECWMVLFSPLPFFFGSTPAGPRFFGSFLALRVGWGLARSGPRPPEFHSVRCCCCSTPEAVHPSRHSPPPSSSSSLGELSRLPLFTPQTVVRPIGVRGCYGRGGGALCRCTSGSAHPREGVSGRPFFPLEDQRSSSRKRPCFRNKVGAPGPWDHDVDRILVYSVSVGWRFKASIDRADGWDMGPAGLGESISGRSRPPACCCGLLLFPLVFSHILQTPHSCVCVCVCACVYVCLCALSRFHTPGTPKTYSPSVSRSSTLHT
jgi:hypothetical protein